MGLQPLEFTDGLTDSPVFRRTLQEHERELEKTNNAIKHLIKDVRELIAAARHLSRAQRTLSETLNNFNFECIGTSLTDDEMVIANSFKDFARLLNNIEDERDRLLVKADEAFLEPIEKFRGEQIGIAKAAKKSFEKETVKYYSVMERYLATSVKKGEAHVQESDASYSIEQWHYYDAMSKYVLKLQEVNERKKFEFVETVLSFMLGWLTFYHQGHEIANDFYEVKMQLQMRLQRTRNNFNTTQAETKSLRQKMLTNKERFKQNSRRSFAREGYLFMMEKKAFSTSWNRYFAQYEKETGRLVLLTYNPTLAKTTGEETLYVKEVVRRPIDTIDRRFCFDVFYWPEPPASGSNGVAHLEQPGSMNNVAHGLHTTVACTTTEAASSLTCTTSVSAPPITNGSGENVANPNLSCSTLQALDEEDYKCWLEVLEAREPTPIEMLNAGNGKTPKGSLKSVLSKSAAAFTNGRNNKDGAEGVSRTAAGRNGSSSTPPLEPSFELDLEGLCFVRKCIQSIERRGLEQKGIYRVVGVASKVKNLMEQFAKHRAACKKAGLVEASGGKIADHLDVLPELDLDHEDYEIKTITSALKNYLRHLNEPLMTFQLHLAFINSAKMENISRRIERIHQLVHRLPALNFCLLKMLIQHLKNITKVSEENLMNASNLGVCFGPTLLWPAEESVAAILDIKFVNVIAELLIEHYELFFLTKPQNAENTAQSIASNAHSIQQRPLPTVPHEHQPALYGTKYGTMLQGSMSPSSQIYAYRTLQQSQANDARFAQDQLYRSLMQGRKAPSMSTAQISPSNQTYPQTFYQTSKQHLAAMAQYNRNVNPMANGYGQQPIYGTTMLVKSASKQVNGQLASTLQPSMSFQNLHHLNQPSMSFQNLHHLNTGGQSLDQTDMKMLPSEMSNASLTTSYARPMTSLAVLAPNSAAANNRSPLVVPTNRVFNLSSSSSTSLPSPEMMIANGIRNPPHQTSFNFPLTASQQQQHQAYIKSRYLAPVHQCPVGAASCSPVSSVSMLEPGSQQSPGYTANCSIYGTIAAASTSGLRPSMPVSGQASVQTTEVIATMPSNTVRTKYVCIGSNPSELSFEPNQIITNVHSSSEPGWLEGTLNGKTGLVPFNYVEFLDAKS